MRYLQTWLHYRSRAPTKKSSDSVRAASQLVNCEFGGYLSWPLWDPRISVKEAREIVEKQMK